MKIIERISYGPDERNYLDLYLTEKENAPVFIYFHGGGLVGCGRPDLEVVYWKMLVEKGINVVFAEYRIYPAAKYPDFINDAADAVLWVMNNLKKYTTYKEIFIGGTSAGGYLSQMICFNGKYLEERGIKLADITGFIHDAGQPTTHFNVLKERGIDTGRVIVDEAAPLYYIDGKKDYPPMLFIVADNDMPNRYEQTMLMLAVMRNYGCDMDKVELTVMENCTHTSYQQDFYANGESRFVNAIYSFMEKTLKKS